MLKITYGVLIDILLWQELDAFKKTTKYAREQSWWTLHHGQFILNSKRQRQSLHRTQFKIKRKRLNLVKKEA